MKKIFDFIDAVSPVFNEDRKKQLESLIQDLVNEATNKAYSDGWNAGRSIGFVEGHRQARCEATEIE